METRATAWRLVALKDVLNILDDYKDGKYSAEEAMALLKKWRKTKKLEVQALAKPPSKI